MIPDGAPQREAHRLMPAGAMTIGSPPLRLRAEDAEDLAVISACLQDALVAVRDLAYDPGAAMFVLVANRFRWEACRSDSGRAGIGQDGSPRGGTFERVLCGVSFANV